jgi:hypothetical protein
MYPETDALKSTIINERRPCTELNRTQFLWFRSSRPGVKNTASA